MDHSRSISVLFEKFSMKNKFFLLQSFGKVFLWFLILLCKYFNLNFFKFEIFHARNDFGEISKEIKFLLPKKVVKFRGPKRTSSPVLEQLEVKLKTAHLKNWLAFLKTQILRPAEYTGEPFFKNAKKLSRSLVSESLGPVEDCWPLIGVYAGELAGNLRRQIWLFRTSKWAKSLNWKFRLEACWMQEFNRTLSDRGAHRSLQYGILRIKLASVPRRRPIHHHLSSGA